MMNTCTANTAILLLFAAAATALAQTQTPAQTPTPITTAAPTAAPTRTEARSYEAYIDSAENFARHERYDEAARCYRNALREKPASPLNSKIFANLGNCLLQTGDVAEAIQALDVASVREPSSPQILTSRARAYLINEDTDKALADLNTVLSIDSVQCDALRMRGQVNMLRRDFPAAYGDFSTLRRHHPADVWGAAGMAEALAATGRYDDAIPLYEEALKRDDNPDFTISLATALINSGKVKEAGDTLSEAIRRHPRTGELYLMRGVVHQRMYRHEDALTDRKTAISLGVDPKIALEMIPERKKSK